MFLYCLNKQDSMSEIEEKQKSVSSYRNIPTKIFEEYTAQDKKLLQLLWSGIKPDVNVNDFIRPIYTKLQFSHILKEIYPEFYQDKKIDTLSQNLEFYAGGGSKKNGEQNYPNLFAKNLIRIYPFVSDSHAPYIMIVSFPFEAGYNLNNPSNWRSKYSPHDPLHRVCINKFCYGISTELLHSVRNGYVNAQELKLPHFLDKNSSWVLDEILVQKTLFYKRKIFIETYTGSENYYDYFWNRLIIATEHIKIHPDDLFIFFFLTKNDVQTAIKSVNNYNLKTDLKINRRNIEFVNYKEIDSLRIRLGLINTYPFTPESKYDALSYYHNVNSKNIFEDI